MPPAPLPPDDLSRSLSLQLTPTSFDVPPTSALYSHIYVPVPADPLTRRHQRLATPVPPAVRERLHERRRAARIAWLGWQRSRLVAG